MTLESTEKDLTSKIDELSDMCGKQESRANALEAYTSELTQELHKWNIEKDNINKELETTKQKLSEAVQEVERLKSKLESLQSENNELLTKRDEYETVISNNTNEISLLNEEKKALQRSKYFAEAESNKLKEELSTKEEELSRFSISIDKKEANIAALQQTLMEKISHIDQLKHLLDLRSNDNQPQDGKE